MVVGRDERRARSWIHVNEPWHINEPWHT